jgi:hypothetical protein
MNRKTFLGLLFGGIAAAFGLAKRGFFKVPVKSFSNGKLIQVPGKNVLNYSGLSDAEIRIYTERAQEYLRSIAEGKVREMSGAEKSLRLQIDDPRSLIFSDNKEIKKRFYQDCWRSAKSELERAMT